MGENFVFPNEVEIQWSILIVLYPFITGLVAGAFVVSSLYHVFNVKALKPVASMSLLVALSFLLVAPLALQAHLGRPERGFQIFLTPNPTSAMAVRLHLAVLDPRHHGSLACVPRTSFMRMRHEDRRLVCHLITLGVFEITPEDRRADEADQDTRLRRHSLGGTSHGYVGFLFGAIKPNPGGQHR
jgi:hypothetical protein